MFFAINSFINILAYLFDAAIEANVMLTFLYFLFTLCPLLSITFRRLHDIGKHGVSAFFLPICFYSSLRILSFFTGELHNINLNSDTGEVVFIFYVFALSGYAVILIGTLLLIGKLIKRGSPVSNKYGTPLQNLAFAETENNEPNKNVPVFDNIIGQVKSKSETKIEKGGNYRQKKIYSDYQSYSTEKLIEMVKSKKYMEEVNIVFEEILKERNTSIKS